MQYRMSLTIEECSVQGEERDVGGVGENMRDQ